MSSKPQCCLSYGVMTYAIPCWIGSPPPPPPPSPPPPLPPLPPSPASTEVPSPCWAPDTAEISQHQESKICPALNMRMEKRPFPPLFPGYWDVDLSAFSLSFSDTEAGGGGDGEMQQHAKPSSCQRHPGAPLYVPPDCHRVCTGQRARGTCLECSMVAGRWQGEGLSLLCNAKAGSVERWLGKVLKWKSQM